MRASTLKFHHVDLSMAGVGRVERYLAEEGWTIDVDGPAVRLHHPKRGTAETHGIPYSFTVEEKAAPAAPSKKVA